MIDEKRLNKLALGLYAAIFLLIAVDLGGDYSDGIDAEHLLIELAVLLLATIGLGFFGKLFYETAREKINTLELDLTKASDEAKHWRQENSNLIAGLANEIQKQFVRWELTSAEAEVGLLLLKGFSHQEIADIRGASERTVREQARAVYRKSGTNGRSALSAFFLEDLLLPREVASGQ
jgi:DNA-binding CsgD family transcriptional regulator